MIAKIMMDFTGTGNSFQVVNPHNWKELEIAAVFAAYSVSGSFEGMFPGASIQPINLEFYNCAAPNSEFPNGGDVWNIQQYRAKGLTGGPGVTMGIPLRIYDSEAPGQLFFDGVLDLSKATWEFDKVVAPIRQNISLDWFYSTIESIDFALLRQFQFTSNGISADGKPFVNGQYLMGSPIQGGQGYPLGIAPLYQYKVTAYTITYSNEVAHIVNMIIEMGRMVNTLLEAIKSTGTAIGNLIGDIADLAGIVSAPAGILQGIVDILYFAYSIANDTVILATIIGDLELLLNQMGFIDKYKYSMVETDIIYAVLTYVNYQNGNPNLTFSSSIYGVGRNGVGYDGAYATTAHKAMTWMPKKKIIVNQSVKPSITNFLNGLEHPLGDETKPGILSNAYYGSPDGNVKKWFQTICQGWNANLKLIPIGGSNDLQLEEMHFWKTPVNFTMPNEGKSGLGIPSLPAPEKDNWLECSYNYELAFSLDSRDENTDLRYNGTSCQAMIQPKITHNILYWLNPGGKTIIMPVALAKTKQWLTLTDDVMNFIVDLVKTPFGFLIDIYNAIGTVINTISSLFRGNPVVPIITWTYVSLTTPYPFLELSSDTTELPKRFIGFSHQAPIGLNEYTQTTSQTQNAQQTTTLRGGNNPSFYGLCAPKTASYNDSCWQPLNNDSPYPDPNGDRSFNFSGINSANESYFSADVLMRLFHSLNLPTAPQNGYGGGNQWQLYRGKQFKMCKADFLKILTTGNVIKWVDGKTPCFLEKIVWKMYDEEARNVDYRINKNYSLNLSPLIISIDGSGA